MIHAYRRTAPRHADQHSTNFNGRLALAITNSVGTMACAYIFGVIALSSLPATLVAAGVLPKSALPAAIISGGFILVISWIAQTFLQLVLLSVILVGQKVQAKATDAQTNHMADGVDAALDRLDVHTAGGIADLRDELLAAIAAKP